MFVSALFAYFFRLQVNIIYIIILWQKISLIILIYLFLCLQIVAGISVFFICTSVISFCLKTLPGLRVEIPLTLNQTSNNLSDIYQISTLLPSTTEANFILSTHRPGLFNRYSVNFFFPPTQYVFLYIFFFLKKHLMLLLPFLSIYVYSFHFTFWPIVYVYTSKYVHRWVAVVIISFCIEKKPALHGRSYLNTTLFAFSIIDESEGKKITFESSLAMISCIWLYAFWKDNALESKLWK